MIQAALQFFKNINPQRLIIVGLGFFCFLIILGSYIIKIGTSEYAILYSDLELQDSSKIVQELERQNIAYQAIYDGSTIKVPKSNVVKARISLARAGLPDIGSVVGYEIFDKEDSIGTTNFSQNIRLIRALEGELSRTISAFEQIERARVHLVMPQREIFSKEKVEPRTSVVLKLKRFKKLDKSEIDAISHLIVTSVPNLEMKNVTIVDTKGTALRIGKADDALDFDNKQNETFRIASEERLKRTIETLLENTLGAGKVKAQVTLDMNFDRVVTSLELYDPDSAVIRSVHSIDDVEQVPVSNRSDNTDVSVANNIPGIGSNQRQNLNFSFAEKSDQITNYEISKTIKNHISESGLIKKMSIAVLVDGQYSENPTTKEIEYTPRSQQDLDKIANLVKVAVGFDEGRDDKLEVINMKFSSENNYDEYEEEWLNENLSKIFETLVFAVVILLILIIVIRPIALKAFEIKQNDEANPYNDKKEGSKTSSNNINNKILSDKKEDHDNNKVSEGNNSIKDKKISPDIVIQKISKVVESNPQDLVNILRKWLNEGN